MFYDIKKILPKAIKRAGIEKQVTTVNISDYFTEIANGILPEAMRNKVRPMYVKNAILTVASLSSVATQELAMREIDILAKINEKAGKTVIEKIRYMA